MRLMIVVFMLVGLLIIDRYRFGGYYGSQVYLMMAQIVRSAL
jgi:hypothetical protein